MKISVPQTSVHWSDGSQTKSTASGILKRILKENNVKTYTEAVTLFNSLDRCKLPKGMGLRTYRLLEEIVKS